MKKATPKYVLPNPRIPFATAVKLRREAKRWGLSTNEAINEAVEEWVDVRSEWEPRK